MSFEHCKKCKQWPFLISERPHECPPAWYVADWAGESVRIAYGQDVAGAAEFYARHHYEWETSDYIAVSVMSCAPQQGKAGWFHVMVYRELEPTYSASTRPEAGNEWEDPSAADLAEAKRKMEAS